MRVIISKRVVIGIMKIIIKVKKRERIILMSMKRVMRMRIRFIRVSLKHHPVVGLRGLMRSWGEELIKLFIGGLIMILEEKLLGVLFVLGDCLSLKDQELSQRLNLLKNLIIKILLLSLVHGFVKKKIKFILLLKLLRVVV